jgi:hypothetical protein
MSHDPSDMDDRTLFVRLSLPPATPPQPDTMPDAMMLAAWLEGRAGDDGAAVEAAFAADPALLADLIALRKPIEAETPSADFLARAKALVPDAAADAATPSATILSFQPKPAIRPARGVGTWLAWSAVAASVACIAVAGFNLGSQVGESFYPTTSLTDQHDTPSDSLDAAASVADVFS